LESIRTSEGRVVQLPILSVTGQITKQSTLFLRESGSTIHAVLRPSAIHTLFEIDARTLSNKAAPLSSLCPDHRAALDLESALLATEDNEERLALLTEFLVSHWENRRPSDPMVEKCLAIIDREIRHIRLTSLLERLGISERQLERRFLRTVGIAPKQYIRIRRVNEALRMMETGSFDSLTDVAFALNYFDQSHFIRDIREFSGTNPRSLTQKVRDFQHDRVGTSFLLE